MQHVEKIVLVLSVICFLLLGCAVAYPGGSSGGGGSSAGGSRGGRHTSIGGANRGGGGTLNRNGVHTSGATNAVRLCPLPMTFTWRTTLVVIKLVFFLLINC